MQRARVFLVVSLGILALAGAFALGTQTAQGQPGVSGFAMAVSGTASSTNLWVMTPNGDVYWRRAVCCDGRFDSSPSPSFVGNFWDGAVPSSTTWGRLKADRR